MPPDIPTDGSGQRPDLAIFRRAHALVEGEDPYSAVVIIEFKKPGRRNYSDGENPVTQVCEYVNRIRGGEAMDRNGRPIQVGQNTPFHCYILADIVPKIRSFAVNASFLELPATEGYYVYNQGLRATIEILSYDSVLRNAKKRNRVLFEKLCL